MKKIIFPLLLLCFFISGYSQSDTLFTKKKQKIIGKIIEINDVEVKYRLAAAMDGPIYTISKEKIYRYTLANGFSEMVIPDELSVENEHGNILDKRTVIKIHPFSFANSQISIAYERVLKVGTNLDIELGYVDNYMNKNSLMPNNIYSRSNRPVNYTGAYIKPGIKFFLGQDFSVKGLRYAHPLKGRYIKLDLALSYLNFMGVSKMVYTPNPPGPSVQTIVSTNINTFAYGGFVNYGRQFILGNIITLEYYVGVGFTGRTLTYSNEDYSKTNGNIYYGYNYNEGNNISNYHGFVRLANFGLSGTAGFRVGYILGGKKDKKNLDPTKK